MSDPCGYLWLIPGLPLLASAITAALGPRYLRDQSHWPCVLGAVGSCVLSIMTLMAVGQLGDESPVAYLCSYYQWFRAGEVYVGMSLRADGLSAIMLVT